MDEIASTDEGFEERILDAEVAAAEPSDVHPSMTAAETRRERDAAKVRLEQLLGSSPFEARTVYTLTTYGRGQTDWVRLFVAKDGEVVEVTFWAARCQGRKVKPGAGIAFGGGGYSKALDAADDVWRALYGRPLDQSKWREL